MGYWSIMAPEGFAGWILLAPLDLHGPQIEVGWRLVRTAWGRGYATEAARPVLEHALNTLQVPEVIADIDPGEQGVYQSRAEARISCDWPGAVSRT
jgi:RimJ/RimL family protein N-acetyltransferase